MKRKLKFEYKLTATLLIEKNQNLPNSGINFLRL